MTVVSWFQDTTGGLLTLCAIAVAVLLFLIIKAISGARDIGSKFKKGETPAPAAPTEKICPYCKSPIAIDATRCPHCTSEVQ